MRAWRVARATCVCLLPVFHIVHGRGRMSRGVARSGSLSLSLFLARLRVSGRSDPRQDTPYPDMLLEGRRETSPSQCGPAQRQWQVTCPCIQSHRPSSFRLLLQSHTPPLTCGCPHLCSNLDVVAETDHESAGPAKTGVETWGATWGALGGDDAWGRGVPVLGGRLSAHSDPPHLALDSVLEGIVAAPDVHRRVAGFSLAQVG